jgi:hypothetical protein
VLLLRQGRGGLRMIGGVVAERSMMRLAGGLLVGGFVLTLAVTLEHPGGHEDSHPVVFAKYAASHSWVLVHLLQFAGVLITLAGFVALYRVLQLRGEAPVLGACAVGAAIASSAAFAVLQAVDGVALKQAVDAWVHASGPQRAIRFADAETVRWIEQGVNTYFRLLFGLTLVLFGTGLARTTVVARWLGWIGAAAGLLYMASGIAVGYRGFESGFGNAVAVIVEIVFFVFVIGVLVDAIRRSDRDDATPAPRTA